MLLASHKSYIFGSSDLQYIFYLDIIIQTNFQFKGWKAQCKNYGIQIGIVLKKESSLFVETNKQTNKKKGKMYPSTFACMTFYNFKLLSARIHEKYVAIQLS